MKLREGFFEIKDRCFEVTAAKLGTMLWDEMKENARLASANDKNDKGGYKRAMKIVAEKGNERFKSLSAAEQKKWEIHIVGHSAGSIFTAYALNALLNIGIPIKSIQFMAPAMSVRLFKDEILTQVNSNKIPQPTLYVLSDKGERDDDVGPYGKSLLYLVSNAFEGVRETPLLGMEKFINGNNGKLDQTLVDKDVAALLRRKVNGWESLVIAGAARASKTIGEDISRSESHGGFDNDPFTMNSVLYRILGKEPDRAFEVRDLQW